MTENVTADIYQQRRLECENNKLQLIESSWSVTTKSGNCELIWYVTPDSIPLESPSKEFSSIGIRNVNWEKFKSLWTKDKATRSEVPQPYLDPFLTVWPGDWKKQLIQLNKVIEREYKTPSERIKRVFAESNKYQKKNFSFSLALSFFSEAIGKGGKLLFEN